MLAAYTTRRLPSVSLRRSWAASAWPAGQRSVPSGWRGKSGPEKRPIFQVVAVAGGPYPDADAGEAAVCSATGGDGRSKFGYAHVSRLQLMPQFQAQVPHPL
jgi:hypothetical protein